MTTATFTKDVSEQFNGTAKLYKLSEPQTITPYGAEEAVEFEYVVASSVQGAFVNETMVFAADKDGDVLAWGELAVTDPNQHTEAVTQAGFEVIG